MHDSTIAVLVQRGTTGNVCLKYPPKKIVLPPNGLSFCMISFNSLSTTESARLDTIVDSSQMIKAVLRNISASMDAILIDDTEFSTNGTGSLNAE